MSPSIGLDGDGPSGLVPRGSPAAYQLGLRAHLAQRHEHVPRLDRAGRDLGQERREQHGASRG